MSTELTHSHEDSQVEVGSKMWSSSYNSDGTSEPKSLQDVMNRATSLGKRPAYQQEAGPSTIRIGQFAPPSGGQERAFNPLNPQLRFGNIGIGRNLGDQFSVDPPIVKNIGIGSGSHYNLPTSNMLSQFLPGSSSRLQFPSIQQPYPHNPLGARSDTPPIFPMIYVMANNPNWQPQNYQLPSSLRTTNQEIQFQGIAGPRGGALYPSGGSVTQFQFPNSQQQGFSNLHLNPREVGETSTRNVRIKMTLPNTSDPSTELRLNNLFNPTGLGIGIIQPPRPVKNSIYDPLYEVMGLPVDPYLRLSRMAPNRPVTNSIYDPAYEAMGLPVDPHLRILHWAKHNEGNNDEQDLN